MQSAGEEPVLPELSACEHLVRYLFDAGPIEVGGADEAPLSWGELRHWITTTRTHVSPWELRTVRELSKAYLQELRAARAPDRPAPFLRVTAESRELVQKQLRNMFRQMSESVKAKRKPKHASRNT